MNQITQKQKKLALLSLSFAALGIVYGDIGTSPLYAINEVFFGKHPLNRTNSSIVGLISVVLWALILVVAVKYVFFILRADNEGEGGVFALAGLLKKHKTKLTIGLITAITFAAGLLFGDGMITPAISVLSAVEGLKVMTPSFAPYVIVITCIILTALFTIQKNGTSAIGKIFGPIILIWFVSIALLGLRQIIIAPYILHALNPFEAMHFLITNHPYTILITLGSVMLVLTGAEALYADMGHFGRNPIRLSWFSLVLPCLVLAYMGQGAYLLSGQPIAGGNIFFSMVPRLLLAPMVLLATLATIIASQALISGSYSLASQGIALGLIPRLKIKYTHEEHEGQIYVPFINWALFLGCIVLVLVFRSSSNLGAAYGLAVSGVMLITTLSAFQISKLEWHWKKYNSYLVFGFFAILDLTFLSANSLKLFKGGFVPVVIGALLFFIMSTWRWGKTQVRQTYLDHSTMKMEDLLELAHSQPRMKRSVLVLTIHNPLTEKEPIPPLVKLFVEKFIEVPKHLIILTVYQTRRPYESNDNRYLISIFENNKEKNTSVISIQARFGFMEEPNVESVITDIANNQELTPNDDMKDWIIYASRERVLSPKSSASWFHKLRTGIYSILLRNSFPTYEYYGLGEDARLNIELLPVRIK